MSQLGAVFRAHSCPGIPGIPGKTKFVLESPGILGNVLEFLEFCGI